MKIPVFKTKDLDVTQSFDLKNPEERKVYFEAKAGLEIKKIEEFLKNNTFVAYLMGKKGSGKGTRAKMFKEILGEDKVAHISVGDLVRSVHKALETKEGKKELIEYLKKDYRGYISVEEGIDAILGRSQDKVSVPDELILSLLKREIDKHDRKALFIDGFPRTLDQISYSLYFRTLIGYRDDPDFFVIVDVPEAVIGARIKDRVVCPKCFTPRGLSLMPTESVGYDKEEKKFFLRCGSESCNGERMREKEGEVGIEKIKDRLEADGALIEKAFSLHGVPKILLRNSVALNEVKEMVDEYEVTLEFYYENKDGKVVKKTRQWVTKDDEGVESVSLLPEPGVLSMIKQIADLI